MGKYLFQFVIAFVLVLMNACLLNAQHSSANSVPLTTNTINSNWTQQQIESANTATALSFLTKEEKETILYVNLARLYPKKFASIEVKDYTGGARLGYFAKNSTYKSSLIIALNSMKSMSALVFDSAAYQNAKCFAIESGENGIFGHTRINCPKGNFAECCSYGMDNGLEIALQWLIDDKVPSLGHRINCLNPEYTKIGVSVHSHTTYRICAVADMIW